MIWTREVIAYCFSLERRVGHLVNVLGASITLCVIKYCSSHGREL